MATKSKTTSKAKVEAKDETKPEDVTTEAPAEDTTPDTSGDVATPDASSADTDTAVVDENDENAVHNERVDAIANRHASYQEGVSKSSAARRGK